MLETFDTQIEIFEQFHAILVSNLVYMDSWRCML